VIPPELYRKASMSTHFKAHAMPVPLSDLPRIDAIVVGSVAVMRSGKRCGKGHGYADLEHAMLMALGQPPVPVASTVHPRQLVNGFPSEAHDLTLQLIATPDELIEVSGSSPCSPSLDWDLLDEDDLAAMPLLQELRRAEEG
jgi:5-formyltetrahydrofolate cyclo-ligase